MTPAALLAAATATAVGASALLTARSARRQIAGLRAEFAAAAAPTAAVTGYCIGGLLAMRTAAAHSGQVAAVAGFHGPVGADGADSVHRLTAEVHLGHAETGMTPEALGELNQVLDAAGVVRTSEIYPGTIHGFIMSDTGAFNPPHFSAIGTACSLSSAAP